jgi:phasin family protein
MAKTNPFFDVDVSKFGDISKLISDFKVPGVDVESVLASQQKNIQALTAANQLAFEGFQAVARRQSEIVRQTIEQTTAIVSELMAAGSPEDKVAKQADLVKLAFEKALANARELAELVAKSNSEAADVINKRVSESLDELKASVAQIKAPK